MPKKYRRSFSRESSTTQERNSRGDRHLDRGQRPRPPREPRAGCVGSGQRGRLVKGLVHPSQESELEATCRGESLPGFLERE